MKKNIIISLIGLVTIPSLGAQLTGCTSNIAKDEHKTKQVNNQNHINDTNDDQYIFVNNKGLEATVKCDREKLSLSEPTFALSIVNEEGKTQYTVAGIKTIIVGSQKLTAEEDYTFEPFTDASESGIHVTITDPGLAKCTKSLYVTPILKNISEYEYEIIHNETEVTYEIVGDYLKPKHGEQFKVKFTANNDDPSNKHKLSSLPIVKMGDQVLTSNFWKFEFNDDQHEVGTLTINKGIIKDNLTITPKVFHADSDFTCSINLQGVAVESLEYIIPNGGNTFSFRNPIYDLHLPTSNRKFVFTGTMLGQQGAEIITLDNDNIVAQGEDIVVNYNGFGGFSGNIDIEYTIKPNDGVRPEDAFKSDSWDNIWALQAWTTAQTSDDASAQKLFSSFYDLNSLDEFVGFHHTMTWTGNPYYVKVMSVNQADIANNGTDEHTGTAIEDDDDTMRSGKKAWFTFMFISAISYGEGFRKVKFNSDEATDENLNSWYYLDNAGFFEDKWENSDIRNELKPGAWFEQQLPAGFVDHVKTIANLTIAQSGSTITYSGNTCHPQAWIRDRFWLPSAVQLGMNFGWKGNGDYQCELDKFKPVFDFYSDKRFNPGGQTDEIRQNLMFGADVWLATPASASIRFETEDTAYINSSGVLSNCDFDNKKSYVPCFCI